MTAPIPASAFTRPTQHSAIARPAGWDRRAATLKMLETASLTSAEIDRVMQVFDEGEE